MQRWSRRAILKTDILPFVFAVKPLYELHCMNNKDDFSGGFVGGSVLDKQTLFFVFLCSLYY